MSDARVSATPGLRGRLLLAVLSGGHFAFRDSEGFAGVGIVDAKAFTGSTILGLVMFGTLFLGAVLATDQRAFVAAVELFMAVLRNIDNRFHPCLRVTPCPNNTVNMGAHLRHPRRSNLRIRATNYAPASHTSSGGASAITAY